MEKYLEKLKGLFKERPYLVSAIGFTLIGLILMGVIKFAIFFAVYTLLVIVIIALLGKLGVLKKVNLQRLIFPAKLGTIALVIFLIIGAGSDLNNSKETKSSSQETAKVQADVGKVSGKKLGKHHYEVVTDASRIAVISGVAHHTKYVYFDLDGGPSKVKVSKKGKFESEIELDKKTPKAGLRIYTNKQLTGKSLLVTVKSKYYTKEVAAIKAAKEASSRLKASESAAKRASEESSSLAASSSRAASESMSMSISSSIAASESAKAASESESLAVSASAAAASSSAEAAAQTQNTGVGTGGQRGDMDTDSAGVIVGNANSHIYHVPGQANYRMNSANAVYFNTEADAQAAGYRKALR
ncbi:sunset domain-containing protein [Ligilactobacillus agilis]